MSGEGGAHEKLAYGGASGGGGGALYVTLTCAIADGFPAASDARASIASAPGCKSTDVCQEDRPLAMAHAPPFTRTSTIWRPLPPESDAVPETVIGEA